MKILIIWTIVLYLGIIGVIFTASSIDKELGERIFKLEQYKTSTEKVIQRLHSESRGHTDEIKELRVTIDEILKTMKPALTEDEYKKLKGE
jgi:hypothetical protein